MMHLRPFTPRRKLKADYPDLVPDPPILFLAGINGLFFPAWTAAKVLDDARKGFIDAAIDRYRFANARKTPADQPIEIDASTEDEGLAIAQSSENTLTISGKALGVPRDTNHALDLPRDERRHVPAKLSFRLDFDQAPTHNVLIVRDWTEQDERKFTVLTKEGMSNQDVAEAIKAAVEARNGFKAKVSDGPNGSVNVQFVRA